MGVDRNRTVIVTSHGDREIMIARRVATEIFKGTVQITGVVSTTVNKQSYFMIAPSGSYYGVGRSDWEAAEAAREEFFGWIDSVNRHAGMFDGNTVRFRVDYICIDYGDVDTAIVSDTFEKTYEADDEEEEN